MTGIIFALIAAVAFGANAVFLRRGLSRGGVYVAVLSSLLLGIPIFLVITLVNGDLFSIEYLAVDTVIILGFAGILHFVVGRTFFYQSVQIIGSNRASAIIPTYIILSVFLGITILSEPFTLRVFLSTILVFIGILLISYSKGPKASLNTSSSYLKGIILSLLSVIMYSITPLLVKVGIIQAGSAVVALLISYVFAALTYTPLLLSTKVRRSVTTTDKLSVEYLIVAGGLSAVGQLCRYFALNFSGVTVVVPIVASFSLFVVVFSYIFNRRIEHFGPQLIFGAVLVILGINASYFL